MKTNANTVSREPWEAPGFPSDFASLVTGLLDWSAGNEEGRVSCLKWAMQALLKETQPEIVEPTVLDPETAARIGQLYRKAARLIEADGHLEGQDWASGDSLGRQCDRLVWHLTTLPKSRPHLRSASFHVSTAMVEVGIHLLAAADVKRFARQKIAGEHEVLTGTLGGRW